MSLLDIATSRKTVRKFKTTPIPEDDIRYILEVARQAPSGSNRQPWRFILVQDMEQKRLIREAAEKGERAFYASLSEEAKAWYSSKGLSPSKPNLTQAPVLLVVLSDTSAPNYKAGVWICIGFAILAIEERGLATVTYTPSDPSLVSEAVGAPEGFMVETVLPLGYSDDPKPKESRYSLSELLFRDRWGIPF